jgi:PAS domain-containing protein
MAAQTLTPISKFNEARREAFHRLKNLFDIGQDFVRDEGGRIAFTEEGRAKLLGLSSEQLRRAH